MAQTLPELRTQIDALDLELLTLLNQRASLAHEVGEIKRLDGSAVFRPDREAQVIANLQAHNSGPLKDHSLSLIWREIMSACRVLEAPQRVAYLGPTGTFSEQAAFTRFGRAVQGQPCATIDDVFRAVENGTAHHGMVPVENSSEGAIGRTLDLLLQSTLQVCGEVMLPVHQCLLAQHCELSAIRAIYSHPQSLGQCQGWLNAHLPNAARIPAASNAEAARLAAENPHSAAVAGVQAAVHFGLSVCVENIEDDARNTTRFLVLGKQQVAPSGNDKTSLVLSAANRPGAVHDLLAPLARHGVSMTRLESRPARSGLWEYVFYMDIEGHQADARVAAALAELRQVAAFIKILGSYPVAV